MFNNTTEQSEHCLFTVNDSFTFYLNRCPEACKKCTPHSAYRTYPEYTNVYMYIYKHINKCIHSCVSVCITSIYVHIYRNMQESYMNTFCTACKHDHVNIVYILTIYSMYSYRNQGMYYSIYTSTATKLSKDAKQLRQCCCAASSKIVKRKHFKCSIKLKQTWSIFADKLEEYKVEYIVNIFWYAYAFYIFSNIFSTFIQNNIVLCHSFLASNFICAGYSSSRLAQQHFSRALLVSRPDWMKLKQLDEKFNKRHHCLSLQSNNKNSN